MSMLNVTLLRCTDLAAADSALRGGKSDPFVRLQVGNQKAHSTTQGDTLNPVWQPAEKFEFEVEDLQMDVLRIDVKDNDSYASDDLIGTALVPVSRFKDTPNTTVTEAITLQVPAEYASQKRASVIHLEICLNVQDESEVVQRIWENETYAASTGWQPCAAEDRKQWSNYNGALTSSDFDEVAGSPPENMESQGWGYVVKKGDQQGWMYAATWFGPWTAKMNAMTYVRRRLWENHCAAKATE